MSTSSRTHRPGHRRQAAAVLLLLAALTGVLALAGSGEPSERDTAAASPPDAADPGSPGTIAAGSPAVASAPPALGRDDAPVTLDYFSDFRCPFCRRLSQEVLPALVEEHVAAGTVQVRWRDLPILGGESVQAALAARAADAQGRFWDYHDVLFAAQDDRFTVDRLRALAAGLELDLDRFDEDLAAGSATPLLDADLAEGRRLGITGTPAVLVGGRLIVGAQPLAVYEAAIDEALAAAGGGAS
jgi:protein-disulfide isomerase